MFFTGKVVSPEDPTSIPAGTATSAFTAAQQNAKNRIWSLLAAASPANIPTNLYRASIWIDNSASTQACTLVQNSVTIRNVAAGAQLELQRKWAEIGTEAVSVVMAGTTIPACIVQETSYI